MNEILNNSMPILIVVLIGLIGYIGKLAVQIIPIMIAYIEAKIGVTNYQKLKALGWDIWNVVEEHFRVNEIIRDTVQAKITMFESLIKEKVPGITDSEIEMIRQSIAGEYNKDKTTILKTAAVYDSPIQEDKVEKITYP